MKEMPEFAKREALSCLRDLASRELQERSWLQGRPGGPVSPAELICELFDDTALDHYLERRQRRPVFSSAVDALLVNISTLVQKIELDVPPHVLLRMPQWLEVQERAAEAVRLIEQLFG